MATLPPSDIQIFTTISSYRKWRNQARENRRTVGYVPTMGALHDGHLSLVNRSLSANDLTVVSIFVNPAQFAPHEDLLTYPRTMAQDLEKLNKLSLVVEDDGARVTRTPSTIFVPTVAEMYPSGIVQDVQGQKGAFVEVKGFGHQMEGQSRPEFFRGVATVVTKLFNVIEVWNHPFSSAVFRTVCFLLLRFSFHSFS
jgi:pantoate--beta-alanine ligase